MNTAISVRLPQGLARQLDSIAKETERSRSFIIQKALESYIEDFADLQIALDRLRDKSDEAVSSGELKRTLDL
ncbi:MAG: ribbon-helix-helix protein, CopG family [Acidobacteria bacterium]|nr:ribbon-helix-helix protein, CopG family [Acidobacteriota bacterium]